jgi:hypothetical protein
MTEVTGEEMQQLVQAQMALAQSMEADGPPIEEAMAATGAVETAFGAAGCGKVKHLLLDHHFASLLHGLWAHADGVWRYRNVTKTEEQGVVQIAFASDRVDACWDSSNKLTTLRCWKHF